MSGIPLHIDLSEGGGSERWFTRASASFVVVAIEERRWVVGGHDRRSDTFITYAPPATERHCGSTDA